MIKLICKKCGNNPMSIHESMASKMKNIDNYVCVKCREPNEVIEEWQM
jgi:protein-arginine kinase activator protein McsA